MAWKASCVMDERMKLVVRASEGIESMTALCARFGVSRKTGYKWLRRYHEEGPQGLMERSRAPYSHPSSIQDAVRERVIAMKKRHLDCGPKKIHALLVRSAPDEAWPAVSTIGDILKRAGLVQPRRRRQKATPSAQPLRHATGPNDVWTADFKGWFRTGNGQRCTPLTISDAYSRYFLLCHTLTGRTDHVHVRPWFERVFHDYGMPRAIRTDNGPPFASTGLGGLTPLSVWWMRLGIASERIEPGHPEQNGRHERLHRTLNQATLRPAAKTARAQQKRFDAYVRYYNDERPHEALGQQPPAQHFSPSPRAFPSNVPTHPDYPSHFTTRKVKHSGCIKWHGHERYLAPALAGEYVGIEPVDSHHHRLYFMTTLLGVIDIRTGRLNPKPNPAVKTNSEL
jgi:putative transposase